MIFVCSRDCKNILHVPEDCCASVVRRKPYMYSVPLTIVLWPPQRLQASVGESPRLTSIELSAIASIEAPGMTPPLTPILDIGFSESIGSINARKRLKNPNRYSFVDIVNCVGTMGAVGLETSSSSSSTDSQSLSSLPGCLSLITSLRLRNLSILAGRNCRNECPCVRIGLLSSRIRSSSTSPTSANIDMRRLSPSVAGCGRTRSMDMLNRGNRLRRSRASRQENKERDESRDVVKWRDGWIV